MVDRAIYHLQKERKAIQIRRKKLYRAIRMAALNGDSALIKEELNGISKLETESKKIAKALDILKSCSRLPRSSGHPWLTEKDLYQSLKQQVEDGGGYISSISYWHLAG